LRPAISRHVLYTTTDEPHSEGLDDIWIPSVRWRPAGRGLWPNGWPESSVTAAAITAVVANKVPMVGKKIGPGQVERHEGCDVMCSRMNPDNVDSHIHSVSVSHWKKLRPGPGLLQLQHEVRHTCKKTHAA